MTRSTRRIAAPCRICIAAMLLACGSDQPQSTVASPPSSPAPALHDAPPTAAIEPVQAWPMPTGLDLPTAARAASSKSARVRAEPAPVVPTVDMPAPEVPAPAHVPAPAPPAAAPLSAPVHKVIVPHTEKVRVQVPSGLQSILDADPRMQPWLNQVMKVVDGCFASEQQRDAAAAGLVVVDIAMHKNARPDADIRVLPASLRGVVGCATGSLMRLRMPLFTSNEGDRFTLRVQFGSSSGGSDP